MNPNEIYKRGSKILNFLIVLFFPRKQLRISFRFMTTSSGDTRECPWTLDKDLCCPLVSLQESLLV